MNAILTDRRRAFREGQKVRNQNVTPAEMFAILENRFLGVKPKEIMDICRMISREMSIVMEDPEKYAGNFLLLRGEQTYPLKVL